MPFCYDTSDLIILQQKDRLLLNNPDTFIIKWEFTLNVKIYRLDEVTHFILNFKSSSVPSYVGRSWYGSNNLI